VSKKQKIEIKTIIYLDKFNYYLKLNRKSKRNDYLCNYQGTKRKFEDFKKIKD